MRRGPAQPAGPDPADRTGGPVAGRRECHLEAVSAAKFSRHHGGGGVAVEANTVPAERIGKTRLETKIRNNLLEIRSD